MRIEITAAIFNNSGGGESSILETFSLFGIAYMMRPFGALMFGHIADAYGRRKALMVSVILMGIPTFLFGCLPTYDMIGVGAPILAFLLRACQVWRLPTPPLLQSQYRYAFR